MFVVDHVQCILPLNESNIRLLFGNVFMSKSPAELSGIRCGANNQQSHFQMPAFMHVPRMHTTLSLSWPDAKYLAQKILSIDEFHCGMALPCGHFANYLAQYPSRDQLILAACQIGEEDFTFWLFMLWQPMRR